MAKRNKYDVDEELEKGFDFSKLKRSAKYLKPYAKLMLLALFLSMLGSLLGLATPVLLQKAIDIAIPEGNISMIVRLACWTLVLIVLSTVLGAIRGIIMSYCGQSIIYDIRKDIFDHLQSLPFSYYDNRPHGKILVRVVNYVNNVSDSLTNGLVNAILELLNIVFIVAYMFSVDTRLSLIILSGMPVLLIFVFLLKNYQKRANFEYNNKNSNLTA